MAISKEPGKRNITLAQWTKAFTDPSNPTAFHIQLVSTTHKVNNKSVSPLVVFPIPTVGESFMICNNYTVSDATVAYHNVKLDSIGVTMKYPLGLEIPETLTIDFPEQDSRKVEFAVNKWLMIDQLDCRRPRVNSTTITVNIYRYDTTRDMNNKITTETVELLPPDKSPSSSGDYKKDKGENLTVVFPIMSYKKVYHKL